MSKKKGGTWNTRYGTNSRIKTTEDVPIIGRENKMELNKALTKSPLQHMDHVPLGPEPIKGTEANPYLGTDAEYMARERERQAGFEKTWGIKHDRRMEETDNLTASDKRVPVTYRQQELPTGDAAKDKRIAKPVVVARKIEVPFGSMALADDEPVAMTDEEIGRAQPVRIDVQDELPVEDEAYEVEVQREAERAAQKLGR
jgi:hypothetical protein